LIVSTALAGAVNRPVVRETPKSAVRRTFDLTNLFICRAFQLLCGYPNGLAKNLRETKIGCIYESGFRVLYMHPLERPKERFLVKV
jgi:hypothetical protein